MRSNFDGAMAKYEGFIKGASITLTTLVFIGFGLLLYGNSEASSEEYDNVLVVSEMPNLDRFVARTIDDAIGDGVITIWEHTKIMSRLESAKLKSEKNEKLRVIWRNTRDQLAQ